MLNTKQPTIIYIVSTGHSGSTLLELLLGRHKEVTGVGEINGLYPKRPLSTNKPLKGKHCNCCDLPPLDCTFWQQIDKTQQLKYGFGLEELDLSATQQSTFTAHNQALFNTIAVISGCTFIIDGSKHHQRLAQLLAIKSYQIKPIHLMRTPIANVCSNARKGNSLFQASKNWVWDYLYTQYLLRNTDHYALNYEDLATNPVAIMTSLMDWLGLPFDQQQLQWNQSIPHRIGGNRRVRQSTDSRIVLDQRWRNALTWRQKATIRLSIAGYFCYYRIRNILGLTGPVASAFSDSHTS